MCMCVCACACACVCVILYMSNTRLRWWRWRRPVAEWRGARGVRRANGNEDEGRLGLTERASRTRRGGHGRAARAPSTLRSTTAAACYITEWQYNIIIMHRNAICSRAFCVVSDEIRPSTFERRRRLSAAATTARAPGPTRLVSFIRIYELFSFFFFINICSAGVDACNDDDLFIRTSTLNPQGRFSHIFVSRSRGRGDNAFVVIVYCRVYKHVLFKFDNAAVICTAGVRVYAFLHNRFSRVRVSASCARAPLNESNLYKIDLFIANPSINRRRFSVPINILLRFFFQIS